jgi:hypothetical protein
MVDNRITRRRALAALGASALAPLAVCSERTSVPSAGTGTAALERAHWMTLRGLRRAASQVRSPRGRFNGEKLESRAATDGLNYTPAQKSPA